jgi:hypothetical protein
MTPDKLQSLRVPAEARQRSQKPVWLILLVVIGAAAVALFYAWPRESDQVRTAGDRAAKTSAEKKEAQSSRRRTLPTPSQATALRRKTTAEQF